MNKDIIKKYPDVFKAWLNGETTQMKVILIGWRDMSSIAEWKLNF